MAGIVESILSIVPQTYRRDVMVLVCGATMATGWFMFDARVLSAEALAAPVAAVQSKVAKIEQRQGEMEQKQAVTDTKVTDIQASTMRIESKVDALLDTLISQNSRGQSVPTRGGVAH